MSLLVMRVRLMPPPFAPRLLGPGGELEALAAHTPAAIVAVAGGTGPAGPSGAVMVHSFAFGDATPDAIASFVNGNTISAIRIAVDEPFNGSGASVSVGTIAAPESLFPPSNLDPTEIGIYENTIELAVTANLEASIFITPGSGATTGRGRVLIFA